MKPIHRVAATATAMALLLQGCGTTAPPSSGGRSTLTVRSEHSAQLGSDVALYAMSMLDQSYRWGGKAAQGGFDCSGLVSHVFREAAGVDLRGNAAAMSRQSRPVDLAALQAGDLLFFNTLGQPSSHVGVYVGQGQFVHAANERSGVRMDRLGNRYYAARFEGAKTVLD
ncbi:C40 family peptidase [Malikia sp.]|uniref:C40 family peptidase n=1 Tax=Malikia sp. TaxID=2070706 RepID=UPI00261D3CE8|nr:C40 family peptidase [Malikia sp.]MDD2727989.1 C40 family peptidase [Malikia sp.]